MVTIRDVAKHAGVTPSTVSRVINNIDVISEKTREKVLQAMRELNYFPNSMARSFAQQNSFTIALLVDIDRSDQFANPFFYEVMHGIEKVVYHEGYFLILANDATLKGRRAEALETFVFQRRVEGIILPSSIVKKSLVNRLIEDQFPFVVLGEPPCCKKYVSWVDIDNEQGGELAVDHLSEYSYKRIAYLGGSSKELFNRKRLQGYKRGLEKNGLKTEDDLILELPIEKEAGYRTMRELLKRSERPDAVICSHNFLAVGALKAAKEDGQRVPDDIGIVSFDNYPLAEFSEPTLTTVDVDVLAMGEEAARKLMDWLKNGAFPKEEDKRSLVPTKILVRESSLR